MPPNTDIKKAIKIEYAKCAADPAYFMERYCKIQHPSRGTIPFKPYEFQKNCLREFRDNPMNIILKCRQMGISTLTAGYSLWLMAFHKDKSILVIATKQDVAKNMITKVRFMNDNLPSWLRIQEIENNRTSLRLANGSSIKAVSASADAGRSEALSLLIMDEAAFIEKAKDIWTAVQSAMTHGGGNAIILSCVTDDTFIFTDKGIRQIKDFVDYEKSGGYTLPTYNVLGVDSLRSGNLFHNNGKVSTKIVRSKSSNIECSFNHKLWAFSSKTNKYGWFRSDELSENDFISIQIGMDIWGNNDDISDFSPTKSSKIKIPFNPSELSNEICYLIGLYISEGSTYKNKNFSGGSFTITCGDDISWVFDSLNLPYTCNDGLHYGVSSKNLLEFFEYLGFNLSNKSNRKDIPIKVLSFSKNKIKWVLRGMFDGDGGCDSQSINYTSNSNILIDKIRIILNNFGILTSKFMYSKEQMNSYGGDIPFNHDIYRLEIYGKNALKFHNTIGFNLDRKSINANECRKQSCRNCNLNTIPNSTGIVKRLFDLSGETLKSLKENHGLFLNCIVNKKTPYKTNDISHGIVVQMFELFGSLLPDDEFNYWSSIISPKIVWERIKSISDSSAVTFDFSLPENPNDKWCHSVIYNGIIGHQTPNGMGNFFHEKWTEAETGAQEMNTIKLHWTLHPEYDQTWRDKQDRLLGPRMAAQECDCDFITSGNSVVDSEILAWYEDNYVREPISKEYVDKGYWKWRNPDYSKTYVVSADCGRGDGLDYSTFHVIELENMEQVAEYKGKLETKQFGNFLVQVATEWNDALLIVENANVGWAVIQQIIDREYKNLFYMTEDMKYVDPDAPRTNKINAQEKRKVAGFTTSSKTRPLIISKLDLCFREKTVIIHSIRTISELYTFIWHNGKPQAADGYNDDLTMALSIGLWVHDTALMSGNQNRELQKMALSKMGKAQWDEMPVYMPNRRNAHINKDPYEMNLGNGRTEDLRWLIK